MSCTLTTLIAEAKTYMVSKEYLTWLSSAETVV